MEEGAREYFLRIEEHYQKRIGRPLILSPKDVAAITAWWERGVPLEAAVQGLDAYLVRLERDPRKRRRRVAVRYAENEVLDAAEDLRAARLGDRRGEGVEDRERIARVLEELARGLEEAARGEALLASDEASSFVEARGEEVAALGDAWNGETLTPEEVEERLADWDAEVLEVVRGVGGEQAAAELRRGAEARLSDIRARMEEKAWERTVALLEEKLLRERYALPRLSLYGY
jgi:hypothetical protein